MTSRVQNSGLARITSLLAAASWWFQWGTGTGAAASATAVTTTSTTEARVAAELSCSISHSAIWRARASSPIPASTSMFLKRLS